MEPSFREITEEDLGFVRDVFNYYILHTTKNYRTETLSVDNLRDILNPGHPKYRSYIITENGKDCGFVYLSQFRRREAYDRTAEITLYLKPEYSGLGIGSKTMEFMEDIARKSEIRVLMGMISGENKESIALFSKMGYQKCAHYRSVAEKFGRILDMVVYQKFLDE